MNTEVTKLCKTQLFKTKLFIADTLLSGGNLHQSLNVVDSGGFLVAVCSSKGFLHKVLLLFLYFHHVLFHGVLHNELGDNNFLLLAQTVAAVDALLFSRWVPGWIHEEDVRGCGQVEPHSSGFEGEQHHGGTVRGIALKLLDHLRSPLLGHRAIETHKTEALLSEWSLQDGEEASELGNHQTLHTSVLKPQSEQVSHQRLNL